VTLRLPARAAVVVASAAAVLLLTASSRFLWVSLPPTPALLGSGWTGVPYAGIGDLPSIIPVSRLDGVRVHVLRTDATERFTTPGFYARELSHWQALLDELGAVRASATAADVIVVPHGLCLDTPARATLIRQLELGGGVLTTGALGSHDGACQPARDTLLVDWLGGAGNAVPLRRAEPGSHYAVVLSGTALGAGIPPRARIEISPADQWVFRGDERGVYFAGFTGEPKPFDNEPFFDGAIARALVGPGRLAAFGFALDNVVRGWSQNVARSVAANALRWAAGAPIVEIAPWPNAARAAVAFSQDVEHEFANGLPAAELLHGLGVPVASYLLGVEADEHPDASRALAALGEVGSHTVDHRPLDRFSRKGQIRQLAWAQRGLEQILGSTVAGLRPPQERFNATTLQAWRVVGGDYVFAANDSRTAAPELVPIDDDTIVLLPRGTVDDFFLIVTQEIRDRAVLTRTLLNELDISAATRGLHVFSFHSHLLAKPELRPVLTAVARAALADSTLWFAQPRDIVAWWRARHGLTIRIDEDGAVYVRNDGGGPVDGAVLVVHAPDGAVHDIALPSLEPGQRHAVPAPSLPPSPRPDAGRPN
jgi:hypothetical protein